MEVRMSVGQITLKLQPISNCTLLGAYIFLSTRTAAFNFKSNNSATTASMLGQS